MSLKYLAQVAGFVALRHRWIRRVAVSLLYRTGYMRDRGSLEQDEGMWHPQIRRHIELVQFIMDSGLPKDARILDVGCGPGWLLQRLEKQGFSKLAGCDQGTGHFPFEYYQVDLNNEALKSFDGGSFDAIIASQVLEHLDNPAEMLREFRRVVTSSGHIYITIPNCWNIFERVHFLFTGNSTRYQPPQIAGPGGHISMFTPHIFENLIDRASLSLVELRGSYALVYGYYWGRTRNPLYAFEVMYHLVPR